MCFDTSRAGPVLQDTYEILYRQILSCLSDTLLSVSKVYPTLLEPAIFGSDEDGNISLYRRIDYRHYISSYGNICRLEISSSTFYNDGLMEATTENPLDSQLVTFNSNRSISFGPSAELIVNAFCPKLLKYDRIDYILDIRKSILNMFNLLDIDPAASVVTSTIQYELDTIIDEACVMYHDTVLVAFNSLAGKNLPLERVL